MVYKNNSVIRSLRLSKQLDDAVVLAAKKERRSYNSWALLQLEKALHSSTPAATSKPERKPA
jgi:predicted HicB family RNase H-like nuclease